MMKNKKIKIRYCPKCRDTKMVELKSGEVEIFKCEKCKFEVEKEK